MVKYPNVLVPCIEKNQKMKKYSDDYIALRQLELKRFLDYCLASETIKQDMLFEKFLDQSDENEYK